VNEHKATFSKFILVGGISTLLNYGVFLLLFSNFKINYLIASAVGYISGTLLGFSLNKYFTYKKINTRYQMELIKYFIVYTISLFLGLGILNFLVFIRIPFW